MITEPEYSKHLSTIFLVFFCLSTASFGKQTSHQTGLRGFGGASRVDTPGPHGTGTERNHGAGITLW